MNLFLVKCSYSRVVLFIGKLYDKGDVALLGQASSSSVGPNIYHAQVRNFKLLFGKQLLTNYPSKNCSRNGTNPHNFDDIFQTLKKKKFLSLCNLRLYLLIQLITFIKKVP